MSGTRSPVFWDEDTGDLFYKGRAGGYVKITTPTFSGSGNGHQGGLVPDPGSSAGSTAFLCEDGTWATPAAGGGVSDGTYGQVTVSGSGTVWTVQAMIGSGATHRTGLVPDPPASSGTTKFLCEDGTWAVPPGTLASPLTTKGDLWAYSSTDARLPAGTDNVQILVPDSAQTLGLKWTTRYDRQTITATGYTTVTLPADVRYVRITCVGGGGGGGGGTTGDNTANRAGGGGGGSGGSAVGTWARNRLPDTIYAYVGAGGAAGTPGGASGAGKISLVEVTNTSFAGITTPQFSSTIIYSGGLAGGGAQGLLGGAGGSAGTAPTSTVAMFAQASDAWRGLAGAGGSTSNGGASGTPTAVTPYSTTGGLFAQGCGGAGKNTTPTAANGGGYAAQGHLSALAGGTAPGGNGTAGSTTYPGSSADAIAYAYGGVGGASHTAGAGGTGQTGAKGCGGGGGGAGTTSGGNGGNGGDGFIVIECW